MSQQKMQTILDDPDKGITEPTGTVGALARLFRSVLRDKSVTFSRWIHLMTTFISKQPMGAPTNKNDLTSMRGNLTKEFVKEQMTWKVFCKGMRFLKTEEMIVIIRIREENSRVFTEHSTRMFFTLNMFDDDEEESEADAAPTDMSEDRQLDMLARMSAETGVDYLELLTRRKSEFEMMAAKYKSTQS